MGIFRGRGVGLYLSLVQLTEVQSKRQITNGCLECSKRNVRSKSGKLQIFSGKFFFGSGWGRPCRISPICGTTRGECVQVHRPHWSGYLVPQPASCLDTYISRKSPDSCFSQQVEAAWPDLVLTWTSPLSPLSTLENNDCDKTSDTCEKEASLSRQLSSFKGLKKWLGSARSSPARGHLWLLFLVC